MPSGAGKAFSGCNACLSKPIDKDKPLKTVQKFVS